MTKIPKISIVIPVYNCECHLLSALDSVLSQTYSSYEVIIVDDGSTDDTSGVIKGFIKANPSLSVRYIGQENAGPSAARNCGIREANGKYIAFLDADDEWVPSKLNLQVEEFEKNTRVGLSYTDYHIINQGSEKVRLQRCPKFIRSDFDKIFYIRNPISTPTIMIRKECFERVGLFDETLDVAEDWDMWLRIFRYYDFVHIAKPLVKVNVQQFSQSSNGNKNLTNDLRFLNKIFTEPDMRGKTLLKAQAYSYRYYKAAVAYKENADIYSAKNAIFKSLKLYPLNIFNKAIFCFTLKMIVNQRGSL